MANKLIRNFVLGLALLSLAGGAYARKITVCHKDLDTISIDEHAWLAHKNHGDFWGSCDNYEKYSVAIIFRCGVSESGNGLVVTTVSASVDIPYAAPAVVAEDDCADANAVLINAKFNLKNVTSGPVDANFETEYFYSRKYLLLHRPK